MDHRRSDGALVLFHVTLRSYEEGRPSEQGISTKSQELSKDDDFFFFQQSHVTWWLRPGFSKEDRRGKRCQFGESPAEWAGAPLVAPLSSSDCAEKDENDTTLLSSDRSASLPPDKGRAWPRAGLWEVSAWLSAWRV